VINIIVIQLVVEGSQILGFFLANFPSID
jgi:hypothetical protein